MGLIRLITCAASGAMAAVVHVQVVQEVPASGTVAPIDAIGEEIDATERAFAHVGY